MSEWENQNAAEHFSLFSPKQRFLRSLQYYPLCFQDCVRVKEPGEFFTLREASIVFSAVASFNLTIGTLLDRRVGFVYHPPIISSLAFRLEERDICPLWLFQPRRIIVLRWWSTHTSWECTKCSSTSLSTRCLMPRPRLVLPRRSTSPTSGCAPSRELTRSVWFELWLNGSQGVFLILFEDGCMHSNICLVLGFELKDTFACCICK